MANVVSVNISERKGEQKHPVPEIQLKFRHGIVGDAHAGDWHRQISLLAEESVDTMRASCPIPLDPGVFAENINTEGIDLKHLPVGTHLRIGETEVEVPQRLRHQAGGGQVRHAHGGYLRRGGPGGRGPSRR